MRFNKQSNYQINKGRYNMEWVKWIFSGIGVFILGLIFTKPFGTLKKNKQVQRSGKNSNNIQAGGNIIINSEKETKKIDEVDLEFKVFEKLKKYNKELNFYLEVARNPAMKESIKLSNYEELNLLLKHIKDFKKEYLNVLNMFEEIDNQSKRLKKIYENYSQDKLWMTESKRENHINMIDNLEDKLEAKIKENKIVRYKSFLKKAEENFEECFSNEKL